MIASVDESVGRLMQLLDELNLADQTVLIFSSDNGGVGGYVREGIKEHGDVTDNAPLRCGKGSFYEGGTRVPFIVRWPNVTQPGSICDVPTIHVDIFPTLLEIAGATRRRQARCSTAKAWSDYSVMPTRSLSERPSINTFPGTWEREPIGGGRRPSVWSKGANGS